MATDAPQRHYRAACPSCGAPVEFQSATAPFAVCGFCRSTVVRSGEQLQRIGQMAELFDDHSPLQLMASGRVTLDGNKLPFTLIGRLQFKSDSGTWTEWIAALDDGRTGTLSEDNGSYVFTRPDEGTEPPPAQPLPAAGSSLRLGVTDWVVAYSGSAQLIAAEGELPKLPALGQPFKLLELRSEDGQVLSIDYGAAPPQVERGRAVELAHLQLKGLKDASVREDQGGRSFACPNCGAPVHVQLDNTKRCTCAQCESLIDLTAGVGGELLAAKQKVRVPPLIPLGSRGQLQGTSWQVVGWQRRSGREPGDDEKFEWKEYLLYHRERGFAFLVDTEDGWSLVFTATGAPRIDQGKRRARYQGSTYTLQSAYEATTTEVLGEFYWPVERGQKTDNHDYANGNKLLSTERSNGEVTASVGSRIDGAAVAEAFGMSQRKALFERAVIGPAELAAEGMTQKIIMAIVVIIVISTVLDSCSLELDDYLARGTGGAFGGYSSGGSHK
ncbi:MAG TPA: DUF4178 domain-containing protein [Ottowia sp.]|uniref:DUF4178 domain-containing protein n=1 Tax=Ottowia sp. TaxID=1898956 RepID=UPI002BF856C3|nr:DUF4178 domain-containing protein [Ottowia sp.]HNE59474.1 DUF4178 domain-containing protein [Ottowia sp.]HNI85021.1 DUF4178 domain-containing protein [Ottowia sp.]HNJ45833.1 DUF4178 domain-containing protein [Ottowia sp.]HNK53196.1 DUF4178 domain-containing protein [Ottowia sp.]HNL42044.1 DUF4178 domain-containing protein [Ottowia sp.]